MALIDSTAVNVALPILQRDLKAGVADVQWIVEGYALFLSALILVGGALGDRFGRKRIFALGILIFTASSIACAASQNAGEIIIARCFQGIGGALLTPGSLALISAAFPPESRGAAFGVWSSFSVITTAGGPLLGGWLAQSFSWRYVFAINVPIAAVVLFALTRCVRETSDPHASVHIDIPGAAAATAGLGAFVYGLIRFQQTPDSLSIVAIGLGVFLIALFLVIEWRERHPMMPLNVFGSRTFLVTNVYTLLLYASLGGSLFFVPFDLINIHRYTPLAAGAASLPTIAMIAALSERSGALVNRIGARLPLALGAFIAGLGFLAYARIGVAGSYWTTFFPAALLVGLGAAGFVAPLTTAVMNAIDTERAGLASGINNAVARTAGLLAIAILGVVLASGFSAYFNREAPASHLSPQTAAILTQARSVTLTGHLPANVPRGEQRVAGALVDAAYQHGFMLTMFVSAGLAFLASALAFALLQKAAPATVR